MKSILSKKGQLNALAPAILALIFAAVVLTVGLVITQKLVDTQDGQNTLSVSNETITAYAGTENKTVAGASTCGFGTAGSVVIYNTTNDVIVLASGNYTAYTDGNIVNLSATYAIYPLKVSYDYTWGDETCVAGNSTIVGLGTFADFWEIIVLAIVITVVIGLLLVVFGRQGRR